MQRLKQNNSGANLRLNDEDLLLTWGRNPGRSGVSFTRIHVQRDGYAERAIHDIQPQFASFQHCDLRLKPAALRELQELLDAAAVGMAEFDVTEDPNGTYRCIDYAGAGGTVTLRIEDVGAAPRFNCPSFEAAWSVVLGIFPTPTLP